VGTGAQLASVQNYKMGATEDNIKEQLGAFANKYGPSIIMPAKVLAVNENDCTIEIEFSDESKIDDARLRSVIKAGNKIVQFPSVGSMVLVGRIDGSDDYVVLAIEAIDFELVEIDGTQFKIAASGFTIKKGTDNLKDAMIKIIEAVEKIVVLQGTNPDRLKLASAKEMITNIFN